MHSFREMQCQKTRPRLYKEQPSWLPLTVTLGARRRCQTERRAHYTAQWKNAMRPPLALGAGSPYVARMTAPSQVSDYNVTARSTDVFGRVLCGVRDHHFVIDGPVQNGAPGEEVTPVEVFLS